MQELCEQSLLHAFNIPALACCLEYADILPPNTLQHAGLVHESSKQRTLDTFAIPASAWCLQYAAVLLPNTLKDGRLVHKS